MRKSVESSIIFSTYHRQDIFICWKVSLFKYDTVIVISNAVACVSLDLVLYDSISISTVHTMHVFFCLW